LLQKTTHVGADSILSHRADLNLSRG